MNIVLASYGFVINFFPTYASIRNRNNSKGILATAMALIFCLVAYLFFSVMAIECYGMDLNPSIFENIKEDNDAISIILLSFFLLIFLSNIPFVFYPGKECFLMFLLELRERRIS
jgi:hypothetical protein